MSEEKDEKPALLAVLWLRLCEMRAAEFLPEEDMRDLTAAIDAVVELVREEVEA
jgi:hypothetical protein